jgi:L-amino acid N-acyltransferase YncA
MDNEDIRILEVNVVSLNRKYHSKGIGKEIYNKLIEGWAKQVKSAFVIIPEKCSVSGSTSDEGMGVT